MNNIIQLETKEQKAAKEKNRFVGQKYCSVKNLSLKEIAKLMRNDIKEAKKRNQIPNFAKVSVRVQHHSSIEIRITQWQGAIYSQEYKTIANQYNAFEHGRIQRYTSLLDKCLDVLQDIHDAYNRDNSDGMTDYFDVNYYGGVSIDYQLRDSDNKGGA